MFSSEAGPVYIFTKCDKNVHIDISHHNLTRPPKIPGSQSLQMERLDKTTQCFVHFKCASTVFLTSVNFVSECTMIKIDVI